MGAPAAVEDDATGNEGRAPGVGNTCRCASTATVWFR